MASDRKRLVYASINKEIAGNNKAGVLIDNSMRKNNSKRKSHRVWRDFHPYEFGLVSPIFNDADFVLVCISDLTGFSQPAVDRDIQFDTEISAHIKYSHSAGCLVYVCVFQSAQVILVGYIPYVDGR